MDDQAETVLLRLARGTGTAGLAAMRPVTPAHVFDVEQQADRDDAGPRSPDQVMLIRPLLCLTRAEVENYCRENELEFRIDPTNLRDGFTRNRIRLRVMPALREINPRVSEALARAADNCAADEDALKVLAAKALDGAITTHECGIRSIYSLRSFAKQPAGLRRRMIIEAAKRLSEAGIEAAAIQALESLITAGRSGKRVELSDVCVWREFDAVVFERAVRTGHYEIRLTGTAEAGGFQFSIDRGVSSDTMSSIHEEAGRERNAGRDWMFAALDDAALPDQLSIRPRVEGERVLVLGQRGPKKLKNLMIDHRIPSSRRATWPVVATPDGEYVWSPGMPPAARFAGSANSLRLAVLRASQCIAGSKSSSAGC
jgi:tRNA(Ile)-lysidine synthase